MIHHSHQVWKAKALSFGGFGTAGVAGACVGTSKTAQRFARGWPDRW